MYTAFPFSVSTIGISFTDLDVVETLAPVVELFDEELTVLAAVSLTVVLVVVRAAVRAGVTLLLLVDCGVVLIRLVLAVVADVVTEVAVVLLVEVEVLDAVEVVAGVVSLVTMVVAEPVDAGELDIEELVDSMFSFVGVES